MNFGRREAPDARDRDFLMRRALDPFHDQYFPAGIPIGARHYFAGPVLDQGNTGTCVAHGWTAKVNAAPIMQKMKLTPFNFYRRIVAVDEFKDNDFEAGAPDDMLQSGTSVRAGAKTLVDLGYANSYLWAQNVEDIRAWILAGFGGVTMGTTWKSGMMNTDADGFVWFAGSDVGGHCYYLNGWNDRVKHAGKTVRAARAQNSWGTSWGQKGRFWIAENDLSKAMADEGEACALFESKLK